METKRYRVVITEMTTYEIPETKTNKVDKQGVMITDEQSYSMRYDEWDYEPKKTGLVLKKESTTSVFDQTFDELNLKKVVAFLNS